MKKTSAKRSELPVTEETISILTTEIDDLTEQMKLEKLEVAESILTLVKVCRALKRDAPLRSLEQIVEQIKAA